uniref:OTU domain-containing protein n=1 Tax=Strongyloides papillosus TaxID=174720 RepID=A0A0N5BYN3_STREA
MFDKLNQNFNILKSLLTTSNNTHYQNKKQLYSFLIKEDEDFTKLIEELNKDLSKKLNRNVKDKEIKKISDVVDYNIDIANNSKVNDSKPKNNDKTINSEDDIQIIAIRERNIESYEISINKENYLYNNNFNVNFYNDNFTYPPTLEIARIGRRYFTLYGDIPNDGHCGFHCMNVITNNEDNGHLNIRREVLTFYEDMQNDINFANNHSWFFELVTSNEINFHRNRVGHFQPTAPEEHWCNDADFSIYGFKNQIRFLIYTSQFKLFNKCWRSYETIVENIESWPLVLIHHNGLHFEIITSAIQNDVSPRSKGPKSKTLKKLETVDKKNTKSSVVMIKLGNAILTIIENKSLDNIAKMSLIGKLVSIPNIDDFIKAKEKEKDWKELIEFIKFCEYVKNEEKLFKIRIKKLMKISKAKQFEILKNKNYLSFITSIPEKVNVFFQDILKDFIKSTENDNKKNNENEEADAIINERTNLCLDEIENDIRNRLKIGDITKKSNTDGVEDIQIDDEAPTETEISTNSDDKPYVPTAYEKKILNINKTPEKIVSDSNTLTKYTYGDNMIPPKLRSMNNKKCKIFDIKKKSTFKNLGYCSNIDIDPHNFGSIFDGDKCKHCEALFFYDEKVGMKCCRKGLFDDSIKMTKNYPEQFKRLFDATTHEGKVFLQNIRAINYDVSYGQFNFTPRKLGGVYERGIQPVILQGNAYSRLNI